MTTWRHHKPAELSDDLLRAAGHELVAQILARRGLHAPDAVRAFLDPDVYRPAPPSALPDLPIAAKCLVAAMRRGAGILVWGDFDVDGQTATALLVATLRDLGATVRAYIPNRLHEGHGIQLNSLRKHLVGVDLLLTCDTGVAEHEAIAYARNQGVTVLVTDHHDLPPELPHADAVVDPKRLSSDHPLRQLPGVGVAYKLTQGMLPLMGQPSDRAEEGLDLVALGIVADVATQTGDTRYLLQRGLQRLRQTRRVGLNTLMQMAKIDAAQLTTDHISFGIGPRLNALGRLGDANLAIELLTTDDLSRARILTAQLEGLNGRRRLLTEQVYTAAQEQIARDPTLLDSPALVLSGPRWHPGIIGIVASRLAETYARPTVLISEGEDGQGRGSARSVAGVDIHAAISALDHMLTGHGGHPGAAGFSLAVERIVEFQRALPRVVETIGDWSAAPSLVIDAVLPWTDLSLELMDTVGVIAPFGEGNPPVVLASQNLELVSDQVFGRDRAHRRLTVRDATGTIREVIWWRGAEHAPPSSPFDLAYQLKARTAPASAGSAGGPSARRLQIEYVDARGITPPQVTVVVPEVQTIDHRAVPDPHTRLAELRAGGNVIVWAEGYRPDHSPGLQRDQLVPTPTLIIWTPPPGPRELQAVLERVSPQTVYFFGIAGDGTAADGFMQRLAGLIKHTLRSKEGIADLERLAAASAQRAEAVREGIHLLAARGDVQITSEGDTTIQLAPGDGHADAQLYEVQARLAALLQETAAYRAYFARTPAERLI